MEGPCFPDGANPRSRPFVRRHALLSRCSGRRPGRLQTACTVAKIETSPLPTLPVSYTVDHRRQRVHAVASGSLSIADLGTYIAARVKDGVYDYDQLIDLSEATLDVLSHDVLDMV